MTTRTPSSHAHENRLARESSPYLRQHAHNPVDWYPWGDEALTKARTENKPILLSVGYSACHWCHVMERESFEDATTARVMNDLFVNIKVDREERPDLDQIYQTVVQLMGRGGGWPLTVFLTPDRKPFFAGTYFPPEPRYGMPSFRQLLSAVSDAFSQKRSEVESSAEELTRGIASVMKGDPSENDVPKDLLELTVPNLLRRADPEHGGFGGAPKFPNTMSLDLLLRAHARQRDPKTLAAVTRSLEGMRAGGIYDQLGGGFHRYSTDAHWLVPHFEKMLYDNALLARLYVDAWRFTGEARHQETARETLEYMLREMRDDEGAFYSAQDADSEGEEGKFFVWSEEEVDRVAGADAPVAKAAWGVTPEGNFEETNVLYEARPIADVARALGLEEEAAREALGRAKQKMWDAREARPKPLRDEKRLATWNGLAISAFAEAGAAFAEPRYLDAARQALDFARSTLFVKGSLLRVHNDGVSKIDAFLEDYGDLATAALDVYTATLDEGALTFARALADQAIERFWDAKDGGFFFSPAAPDLLVRTKDLYDNATPSGTSSLCHVLLRLHALTEDARYLEHAERTLRSNVAQASANPMAFGHLLCAMDRYLAGPTEITVVGDPHDPRALELLAAARRRYSPNLALRLVPRAELGKVGSPALRAVQTPENTRPFALVCEARTCSLPITEPAALLRA